MQWWAQWAWQHAPSWVRGAVEWLVNFVLGVAGVITGALTGNRSGWLSMYRALNGLRHGLSQFAVAVPQVLTWLKTYFVPRLVALMRDALVSFVRVIESALRRAFQLADALIDRAWRAATAALSRVVGLLSAWAREAVSALWSVIPEPIRRAWQLLLDPRRLAEWVAQAVFFALLRLAERQAEFIGRWLLSSGNRFTLVMARVLVRAIERIL